jgi:hypothetical protein
MVSRETSRCAHLDQRPAGSRYCRACRAAYMREYRTEQKLKQARLRRILRTVLRLAS